MRKKWKIVLVVLSLYTTLGHANEAYRVGVEWGFPYSLLLGGSSATGRMNMNIGLDGRYHTSPNFNLGLQYLFDVEDTKGTRRQRIAPGLQYHWMPLERWDPYFRFDLPVTLRGAPSTSASSSQMDLGLAIGLGLLWNLGDAIGFPRLMARYDFALQMNLGLGDARSVLALDLFRVGFDYRF